MFCLDNPVPGMEMEALTPEVRTLTVTANGPSFKRFEKDRTPSSVTLNPRMSLSKLKAFLVMVVTH